jgi:5-formyltetrahydrofolate cyclo-ligase
MWRGDSEEKKLVLRKTGLARRNSLTEPERLVFSRAIQSRALQLPPYQVSRCVALYSATQNEVSTEDILNHALALGRRVFYPRSAANDAPELAGINSGADLSVGRYGIREPGRTERLSPDDCPGLSIFVPGVAFDRQGNRLGRGKGWYDRLLAQFEDKAIVVALAYQFQIVEEVPVSAWDRKVHYIVTENEVIDCNRTSEPQGRHRNQRGCFN